MPYPSGNAVYDVAAAVAESTRQVAVAAATTQAAATATVVAYLTAVIAAGAANGIQVSNEVRALNSINSTGNP